MHDIQASDIQIPAAILGVLTILSIIVSFRARRMGRRDDLWFNLSMVLTPVVAWLLLKRLGIPDDHTVCRGCGTIYPKAYDFCLGCGMHYADPVEITIEAGGPGKPVPEDGSEGKEGPQRPDDS